MGRAVWRGGKVLVQGWQVRFHDNVVCGEGIWPELGGDGTLEPRCACALHSKRARLARTFLRQGPQLQQMMQPAPQEPRQQGQTQQPLAAAASASSPWRFFRHLWQKE